MNNNFFRETPYISNSIPSNYNNYDNYNTTDYVEYYLKERIGQHIKVYVSFADSTEWRNSVFVGTLKYAGKDYIAIYDDKNGNNYVIWNIYIDYVIFDEKK